MPTHDYTTAHGDDPWTALHSLPTDDYLKYKDLLTQQYHRFQDEVAKLFEPHFQGFIRNMNYGQTPAIPIVADKINFMLAEMGLTVQDPKTGRPGTLVFMPASIIKPNRYAVFVRSDSGVYRESSTIEDLSSIRLIGQHGIPSYYAPETTSRSWLRR